MNQFLLSDKKILVTGASSGIGYTTCLTIAELGGVVIAVGRNEENLKQLMTKLKGEGHSYISCDLSKMENIPALIEGITNIDGFVHSAGIVELAPAKFYNVDLMDKIRLINYDSLLILMNQLLKKKKLNKNGSIVLVSSISGLYGMKGNGIYAGTKAALIGLSKVLANELAGQKINVNCVAPGMVRTKITEASIEDLSKEVIELDEKKYPLGYGDPEDVANSIVFLLSSASKWITGQTLILDGGRTTSI
ncbi:MAG: hypothetical protein RL065_711 [Bacteroidota bacterium]|jgi:NAD(P)-dependent dehydrogenase (short-subunit alcohol dehydrogenase family)